MSPLFVRAIQQRDHWSKLQSTINSRALHYYPSLRKVRDYVGKNSSKSITLSEAASIAGQETKYFSRFFHLKVGITFTTWKNAVRIQKAINLIDKEHCTFSNIAFSVGFEDLRTFQRVFKRLTGMTPRGYRKSVETSHYRLSALVS